MVDHHIEHGIIIVQIEDSIDGFKIMLGGFDIEAIIEQIIQFRDLLIKMQRLKTMYQMVLHIILWIEQQRHIRELLSHNTLDQCIYLLETFEVHEIWIVEIIYFTDFIGLRFMKIEH